MPANSFAAKPFKVPYTIRARDGAPAINWVAEIWTVAGRVEIYLLKNGQAWSGVLGLQEVLGALRAGGSHKAHPRIARKIAAGVGFVKGREAARGFV